jgi:hypothetical protein
MAINFMPKKEEYSQTEKKIGTWIDGKPIYRKVIIDDSTAIPVGETAIAHGISNLKLCINIIGFKEDKTGNRTFLFPYMTNNAEVTCVSQVTNTSIIIRAKDSWSTVNKTYFILEYTKTTD